MKRNLLTTTLAIGASTLLGLSQVQAEDNIRMEDNALTNERVDESARARMRDQNPAFALTADDQEEIKSVMYDYLNAAFDNDLEDMIDNFAKADRERLDEQHSNLAENRVEDNEINAVWNNAYGSDFDDGLETAAIPVQFGAAAGAEGQPRTVQVSLIGRNGEKTSTVNFIDEGVIKTTWAIDVPDSLTAQKLNQSLQQLQSSLGQDVKAETNAKAAYQQYANKVLKVVSSVE